jgi:hypothetical protein
MIYFNNAAFGMNPKYRLLIGSSKIFREKDNNPFLKFIFKKENSVRDMQVLI